MTMNRVCGALLLAVWATIVGCGDLPPVEETASGPAAPAAPTPAPPGDPNETPPAEDPALATTPAVQPPAAQTPAAAPAENMPAAAPGEPSAPEGAATNDTVAGVGVGKKGQNYGGPGIVTTPVEAYFRAEERIAFEVQIPKAMQLYKAEHNNKGPKTHEEYMNIIIKENGVQLPELPAGEEYLYDPKTEQLLVKRPAQ
jgi:hypothetical protein